MARKAKAAAPEFTSSIRHREYGTMSLEQAQIACAYLNTKHSTDAYQPKNRFRNRWIIIEVLPVCDLRCIEAHGDECNCRCGGKHHQEAVA